MSAHNEALIAEVHRGKRALEQLKANIGHLEDNINELVANIGDVGKGTGALVLWSSFPPLR